MSIVKKNKEKTLAKLPFWQVYERAKWQLEYHIFDFSRLIGSFVHLYMVVRFGVLWLGINCRFWTTSASGLTKTRKNAKIFNLGPYRFRSYAIVVFCGLFSTLLWTFCSVLWTFSSKIKENIYVLSMVLSMFFYVEVISMFCDVTR